jgi:ketol-acid reductoisomerase
LAKFYYEKDADFNLLDGKTIAIIGYGSQGHAHAQNLKDSGASVIIGQRPGKSADTAKENGFEVFSAKEASEKADIVMMLVPDQLTKQVYDEEVQHGLTEGNMLMFAHGFNIIYNQIVPPANIDVTMIAPKGPGHMLRRVYTQGIGMPALIAVQQDYTGNAKKLALAYAHGIGSTKAGVLETTFKEETETDLFGEQCVLCGGLSEMIKAGFETLVEAGYQPEVAYFECLHEVKLIADLINEKGITGMRYSISDTAEYGDLTVGPKVIGEASRKAMKEALERIQNGQFAKDWIDENKQGRLNFDKMREEQADHQIERVGKEIRSMMSWLQ